MFNRYLLLAATMIAAPAFATAAPAPAPRTAAPAPAAQATPPTRAAVIKNLDTTFKAVDTNGDGTLSTAEVQAAELKVQQQRVVALRGRVEAEFARLDTNKDGQLSKAEFMAAAPAAPSAAPNGAALLGQLDKNKDGKVSLDEYRAPLLSRFDAIDTNHDGTISATEREAAQAAANRKK